MVSIKIFSGTSHPSSKVSYDQVQIILELHKQGVSRVRIAKQIGVADSTIGRIIKRETRRQI